MRIYAEDTTTPKPALPAVDHVIEFVPWPFASDKSIPLRSEVLLLANYPPFLLQADRVDDDNWVLDSYHDNIVVTLSDGRTAVTNKRDLREYVTEHGGVSIP